MNICGNDCTYVNTPDILIFNQSPDQATALLRRNVRIAETTVLQLITVSLTDGRFDALASFTFNLGAGALQRSTLRKKMNRGEYEDVPAELMKWVWSAESRERAVPCCEAD